MSAVHALAPARLKILSLTSVVFIGLAAGTTCVLRFVILTLSRQPEFVALETGPLLFSFTWPSLAYAVDIVAWDLFFPVSLLFASGVFAGGRLAASIRWSMILSAVLALAGLSGALTGDMGLRNIGIVGYVGVFFLVVLLLGLLFQRSAPGGAETTRAV
jgi:hypothetical protein